MNIENQQPAGRILDGKTHDDLAWSKTDK